MKKILVCAFSVFFAVCSSFAGDAASFDDIGFSEDGKYYLFGQYGKTDKTYEPWAEIYTVDVAANDFVKGEVFKSGENYRIIYTVHIPVECCAASGTHTKTKLLRASSECECTHRHIRYFF